MYMYMCVCVCIHACVTKTCACIYMYIHTYIHIYTYIYIYIYSTAYTHSNAYTHNRRHVAATQQGPSQCSQRVRDKRSHVYIYIHTYILDSIHTLTQMHTRTTGVTSQQHNRVPLNAVKEYETSARMCSRMGERPQRRRDSQENGNQELTVPEKERCERGVVSQ